MADCGASGVSQEDSPELAKSAPANDQGAFPSLYSVVISSELGFLGELDESFLVRHPGILRAHGPSVSSFVPRRAGRL